MRDRLRELIDLVLDSLDDPGTDGTRLACRAHFSRDHLDRLVAAATGETPVGLRRRLLLERAAWQLQANVATAGEAATAAGYGSLAAFSRAFRRAYGVPPSVFAASPRLTRLDAPNGVHFHPPAGLLIPGERTHHASPVACEACLARHLHRVQELLEVIDAVPIEQLTRPLRPGFVVVRFQGEEATAAEIAERLVYTLEVWIAAIAGGSRPPRNGDDLVRRARIAGAALSNVMSAITKHGTWDDAFVDALCEPPQSFVYRDVFEHILDTGETRQQALAGLLEELGGQPPGNEVTATRPRPGPRSRWTAQRASGRGSVTL